ncbi:MAG: T9SS type A sorting domain-containing protein [Bacteroidota bacterium]
MKRQFLKQFYGLITIVLASIAYGQAPQLQNWCIPVNSVNFTSGTPVTSLLPSSSAAGGYYNPLGENQISVASNSMHDSNGDLLFFVTQDLADGYLKVFDKNANLVGNGVLKFNYTYTVLVGPGVGTPTPTTSLGYKFNSWAEEISIIPVPGNCNQFYIIAGFKDEHNISTAIAYQPVYAKIDLSIGVNGQVLPVTGTSNLKAFGSLAGMPAGAFLPYAPSHKHRFGIAATPYRPEIANKNYFLYIYSAYGSSSSTSHGFFKYQISSTGISFLALESPVPTYTFGSHNNYYSEMELIKLPSGNYRIAKVIENNNIYCCDLDYVNGSIIAGTEKTINLAVGKSIEGLEFSPNGNHLYYTYHGATNKIAVLQNVASATPTQTDLLTGNFGFIEMGFDSRMYFSAADHLVSKVAPDILPGGSWNMSAATLNPDIFGQYSYLLPDQLDGNIYYIASPTISGNANPCMSASEVYTLSGAYDPSVNYNWTISGGTPSSYSGTSHTLAITWTGSTGTVSVQAGCSKPTIFTVTTIPSALNPDFTLSGSTIAGNLTDYRITATPVMTPPAFWWEVSEIDITSGLVVPGTTVTNNQTWWYAPFIASNAFPGYDYSSATAPLATGYSTTAPFLTPPYASTSTPVTNPGKFKLGKKYRITRGVWGPCTAWTSISKTIYLNTGLTKRNSDPFIVEDDSYTPEMPSNMGVFTTITDEPGMPVTSIKIYPNPNKGSFVVMSVEEKLNEVSVYDVTGKLVYSKQNIQEKDLSIDISTIASGFYYVKILCNGNSYSQKIIKE